MMLAFTDYDLQCVEGVKNKGPSFILAIVIVLETINALAITIVLVMYTGVPRS